jgi:hypothetical protein
MGIKVEVHGVREVLAELRKYERETYVTIEKDLKSSAKPAADAVGRDFPDKPLSNWHAAGGRKGNSRLPAYNKSAKNKVRVDVSTKKPKGSNEHGLMRLQQSNAGGQIYDTAGSGGGTKSAAGQRFVSNLDKHLKTKSKSGRYRSRVMYPSTKKNLPLIEKAVEVSIRKIDGLVQKRIERTTL